MAMAGCREEGQRGSALPLGVLLWLQLHLDESVGLGRLPESHLFTLQVPEAASPQSRPPACILQQAYLGSFHLPFGPLSTLLKTICWGGLMRATVSSPLPMHRADSPQPGLTTHVLEVEATSLSALPTSPIWWAFICSISVLPQNEKEEGFSAGKEVRQLLPSTEWPGAWRSQRL